jgi:elongation factor P--(R)-beta-lysine ligase
VTRTVFSPADQRALRSKTRVRVGGRVNSVEKQRLDVSDALGSIVVRLASPASVEPGDLVVVEGRMQRGALTNAKIVERTPCPTPRGDGEISRFLYSGVGRALEARARAFAVIREYFAKDGFLEVDSPARVRTPGLDLHVDALPQEKGHLVTSPEFFLKRLLVGGLPRIYQLSHCFRADESGRHHEPEFTLLEWYRAFSDQQEIIDDTEQLVVRVVDALGKRIPVKAPFQRMSVREAFQRFANERDAVELAKTNVDRYFELLVDRVEPGLAKMGRPVFLMDYPLSEASLARPSPRDCTVAERFELYFGGLELCNGFGELTDAKEQRRRFVRDQKQRKKLRRPAYALDERFLSALEEGMPNASGNALGVDRLIALATGAKSIADVMPFPESWR